MNDYQLILALGAFVDTLDEDKNGEIMDLLDMIKESIEGGYTSDFTAHVLKFFSYK